MGISERKQRQKEHVRQNILEAAWKLVREDGWEALSIRNIAEAIEYSAPVIYNHFSSKEILLQEFYKEGFELLEQKLTEISKGYEDPDEKLYAVGIAYWDFAFEHKQHYQLMFGVNIPCCYRSEHATEIKRGVIDLMHGLLKASLDLHGNETADVALKRSTFWCILHGLVSINITGRIIQEEGKMERVFEDAVKGFIKSLRKD